MSDESKKLNPEQKKLEASLGRFPLPKSSINRDELMYQSGWAAALASVDNPTGVVRISDRNQNAPWVWRATALLTSAAAVVLGVLLMIQSGQSPNSTVVLQVGDEGGARSGKSADLILVNGSPETIESSLGEERYGKNDIVELMLDYPSGQILTSGLSFQSSAMASQPITPGPVESESQALDFEPLGQRRLLQELLPVGRPVKRAWPTFSF